VRRGPRCDASRFIARLLTGSAARRSRVSEDDSGSSPRAPQTPPREDSEGAMTVLHGLLAPATQQLLALPPAGPPLQRFRTSASAPDIAAWHRAMLSATLAETPAPPALAAPAAERPAELRAWRPSLSAVNLQQL
jgi:hypothetical protein